MEQKRARAAEEPARLMCDDALTEVFRRLPARALAACRLVCKSWMTVLTDPHFIHEHLSRSRQKLLLFASDRVSDRSLAMVLADDNKSMYQLSRPAASRSVFVHNSCNGLLCLGDSTGASSHPVIGTAWGFVQRRGSTRLCISILEHILIRSRCAVRYTHLELVSGDKLGASVVLR